MGKSIEATQNVSYNTYIINSKLSKEIVHSETCTQLLGQSAGDLVGREEPKESALPGSQHLPRNQAESKAQGSPGIPGSDCSASLRKPLTTSYQVDSFWSTNSFLSFQCYNSL